MPRPISVLIVDDNPDMALTLSDVLKATGFEARAACSGSEALAILGRHPVDILLTDVAMPRMSGVALHRQVKKDHPRLTTILMTAYAADDLIQQGMQEGIRAVLNKPVDMDALIAMLRATGTSPH
jgi:CheY-like chemotaxis protein